MKQNLQQYNDTEVRLRMVENAAIDIKNEIVEFKKTVQQMDAKLDSRFMWIVSIVFGGMLTNFALFGTVVLHFAKLV